VKQKYTYDLERETFDCSRRSLQKGAGRRAVLALAAPRQKMWVTRRKKDGAPRQVFVERLPADFALYGLDMADELCCGAALPRLSERFRTSIDDRDVIHRSWTSAHHRIMRELGIR